MTNFMNLVTMKMVTRKTMCLIVLTTVLFAILWANPAYAKEVDSVPGTTPPIDSEPVYPGIGSLQNIDVQVDGDHLVFGSVEDMEAFLTLITNRNEPFLDAVEASLGYVSLRTAEEALIDSGEIDESILEDPYLATALGEDAIIQIDNKVSLVTLDYVYSVDVAQVDLLDVDNISRHAKTSGAVEEQSRANTKIMDHSCTNFRNKHRLCGKTTRTFLPFMAINYTSVTGRTYAEEKKCILWGSICWWRSEDIDQIGLDATVDLDECWSGMTCAPYPTTSTSKSKTDASGVSKTYAWAIGFGALPCLEGSANTHHTGTRNNTSKSLDTDGNWNC